MKIIRKLSIIVIIVLFILNGSISINAGLIKDILDLSPNNGGDIDQSQTDFENSAVICGWYKWAQSFIPSKDTLSSVELLIGRNGFIRSDLILTIKKDLDGDDLTTISVQYEGGFFTFPNYDNYEWVLFDFSDIDVNIGETYYIMLYTKGGFGSRYARFFSYGWGCSKDPDSYLNGDCWFSNIFGEDWRLWEQPFDFCFKTYSN